MSPALRALRLEPRSCPSCGAKQSEVFRGAKLDARKFGEFTSGLGRVPLGLPAGNFAAIAFKN